MHDMKNKKTNMCPYFAYLPANVLATCYYVVPLYKRQVEK